MLRSVEPKVAGVTLGLAIAVVAFLGTVQAAQGPVEAEGAPAPGGFMGLFYLDGEYNLAALVSAAIWALAATALYAAGKARERGRRQLVWSALSLALLYLAVDEALKLHERLEAWSGLDWQLLYLPVLVGTALAGLVVFVWAGAGVARLLLAGAGAAAAGAQVLERVQWKWNSDQPIDAYRALMVPEEILEPTAAALIVVAALILLRETHERP